MGLDETAILLGDALNGDENARGALLERLRPRIVLWAATRMSPSLRAKYEPDDVAQEVLIAVHKGLDRFENRETNAFKAWLFRVAENRIRDLVDYAKAKKRQPPEPVTWTQTSPSSAADRKESVVRLREAIENLPEDYKEVLKLRRFQELNCSEVAQIMNRSENAVRVLYYRAIRKLAENLDTQF